MPGGGSKPGERRGGRKPGTPNKLTGDVKAMVLGALHKAGGEEYLFKQSAENPTAFMVLVGKVLPMTVAGAGAQGEHVIKTVREIIDHRKD